MRFTQGSGLCLKQDGCLLLLSCCMLLLDLHNPPLILAFPLPVCSSFLPCRDNRLVNWDCVLRTAISDIEVRRALRF